MDTDDPVDNEIMQVLGREGRISNLELAGRVGLSPVDCLRRVRELERRGLIAGCSAVLDPAGTEAGLVAYVTLSLSQQTGEAQEGFEQAMRAASQVRECQRITDSMEYLLRVEVADMADYEQFRTDILGALPQVSVQTTFVITDSSGDERA